MYTKPAMSLLVCTRGVAVLCACSNANACVRAQKGTRVTFASIRASVRCQFPPGLHRRAFTPSTRYANIMCTVLKEEHLQSRLTYSDHALQTNTLCWGFDENSSHLPHMGVRCVLAHVSKGHCEGPWAENDPAKAKNIEHAKTRHATMFTVFKWNRKLYLKL